ncbi:MAG: cupin domain-containing protein [Hydrogenophaga sp.]|jgi:quercetin dioxygenase-like cupin family protein|uniref:cupin domain-containing protein n=1 Tax=Betaproteobacteria TaxID=28216 RepID=UPI000EC4F788|nr:cupin domain-containing protein [Methyloversatilis discipulorum]MBT9515081.1 cupin domain-containing protein [Methyloversatilis discipulorum]MDP3836056.1 cupin domain-containing protein [Hydrogenophaga sp.]RJP66811.1 MAG: cupin [Comamonadaceae bacterium]
MALHHLESGEIANLRPLGGDALSTQSSALFKTEQLEVIRLVIARGREMPLHKVPGEITVQCLEGVIEFETPGRVQKLQAGQLLFLRGGVPHSLRALEDACVLVTILLWGPPP